VLSRRRTVRPGCPGRRRCPAPVVRRGAALLPRDAPGPGPGRRGARRPAARRRGATHRHRRGPGGRPRRPHPRVPLVDGGGSMTGSTDAHLLGPVLDRGAPGHLGADDVALRRWTRGGRRGPRVREEVTYGELAQRITATATALGADGIEAGDRALFSVRPRPEGVVL